MRKPKILIVTAFFCCLFIVQSQAQRKTDEHWYGIYIGSNKVGWTYNSECKVTLEGKIFVEKENRSVTRIKRLGSKPVEISSGIKFYFTEDGKPVKGRIETKISLNTIVHKIIFSGKTMNVVTFSFRDTTEKQIAIPENFYLEFPFQEFFSNGEITSGKSFRYKTINAELGFAIIDEEIKIIGRETVQIVGEFRELWHCEQIMKIMGTVVNHLWVDEQGIPWKTNTSFGGIEMSSVKMSRDVALKESLSQFDLALSASFVPNEKIPDPQKVIQMKIKLENVDTATVNTFPRDHTQQIAIENGTVYVSTESFIPDNIQKITLPVKEKSVEKYLEATTYCQSDDSEIKKKRKKLPEMKLTSLKRQKKTLTG